MKILSQFKKAQKITHFVGQTNNSLPPLFVNSMPKAGTNMVEKLFIHMGYLRSFNRCYTEHNIINTKMNARSGRMHIGHLFNDDPIHKKNLKTVFVYRDLWKCLKSYINYMAIDASHDASAFIKEGIVLGQTENYVEKLLLTSDNPLGRSLIFEYERFYAIDRDRYDIAICYDDFLKTSPSITRPLANIFNLDEAQIRHLMKLTLESETWTKNTGSIDLFQGLDQGFLENLKTQIQLKDKFFCNV